MLTISWSSAATVPNECHSMGAKSGTTSLFLLKYSKELNNNYSGLCKLQMQNLPNAAWSWTCVILASHCTQI